jgi:lipopolysaccharide transport system permease protein
VLGRLWPLVSPLVLFAVYFVIFTQVFGFKLGDLPESQRAAMGVFMFLGAVVWSSFAESLSRSTTVLVDNGTLIKKLAFPAEILPLNVVLSSAVTSGVALAAFVVITLVTPLWRAPGIELAWAPAILLFQLVFTYGLALFVSALNVFLRDTQAALGVVLTVWMFATPVFWIPVKEALPSIEPWLPWIERNPLFSLVQAWRGALMSSEPALVFHRSIGAELLAFAPWAAGSVVVGGLFFALVKRRFADEV